ncbi:mandelate racemase/muconate lactonizing enzyme family protein [Halostagnicola bangensis]
MTPTLSFRRFSLPLESPLETAHGRIEQREGFLVKLTDGDAVGYGEATPLPGWTESLEACERGLEQARAVLSTEGTSRAIDTVDDHVAARHGVTLAVADLRSARDATPLYQYLGGDALVGRVPVNATISDGTPGETAEAVETAVSRGFDCCKLKVGVRPVETDIERVRQARAAAGPEVELRADANGAWTIEEAESAIEGFADYGVSILEQPLPAGALEGHVALRGRGVGIGLDEGLLEHGVDAICEAGAADAIVLKPMALGGLDIAQQISAWLRELEVTPIVTTTIDAVVARTGAVHLAAAIPDLPACGLATGELLAEDLGPDPVLFESGSAVVPQAKGLGVSGLWSE